MRPIALGKERCAKSQFALPRAIGERPAPILTDGPACPYRAGLSVPTKATLTAIGRIWFSTQLLEIGRSPSPTKRVSCAQRLRL